MPRAIAIMNQKGGVGKTTTALNLGAVLAQRGKRVLLIDLDPQANLTLGLGRRAADLSESVYELLTDPKADAMKYIVPTKWERLHLVPSHIDLSGAEIEMVTMIGRETRLNKALAKAREHYDYILIDCLPSLSLLTVNAMAAAGEVFVPLQAHPFALEGLGKLFEVVGMIREAMNPILKVSGVLVTMFDGRTNVSKDTLETLRRDERLSPHIFTTTIRVNIKVAESQKDGVPVVFYDAACHASKAYQALGSEVLEMESGCLASACEARITAREEKRGDKTRTFTPDLLAPVFKAEATSQSGANGTKRKESVDESEIPATSEEHASPVSALVHPASVPAPVKSEAATVVVESAHMEPHASAEPQDAPEFRNSPDVETLHPARGIGFTDETAEPALNASANIGDEDYRPRLNIVPGSCKVPLPPP